MSSKRIAATLVSAIGLVLPVAAQDLPDGPGKPVFEKMCTQCHGVEGIVREKLTKDRWTAIVDDMVSRGAKGTDEEVDQVINYLAANFGRKVNVNKATTSDLTAMGLTPDEAQAVIKYRVEKGSVKDFDDLSKVPGLATAKLAGLKPRVEF
jgi:competence ComEA-like helix-hairpin-helix protein